MVRIAILDDYQDAALASADWSPVGQHAQITVFNDHVADKDALAERLSPFDAICIMRERTPLTAGLLARLPKLRFIGSNGARNAAIDIEAAHRRGIVVSGTDSRGNGAPELAWALILAAARHIPAETASFRSGGWQVGVGSDLEGATLGIVGLGRIGKRMASVGGAFGMDVAAWSPNLDEETARAAGARLVDRDTLLRTADWVTLHVVLSDRSRGMIGARELGLMKPSAWLVNTSRGPLVDEAALIGALTDRRIAGAALDVFNDEPLPGQHPLRTLPNVVATPHVGFVTRATYAAFYGQTVENLLAWIGGKPIRTM